MLLVFILLLTGCGSANTTNSDKSTENETPVVVKVGVGSYTTVSGNDVVDGKGSAEVVTTYAAVAVDAEGIIKYVHFDTAQNKANIDGEGKVSIAASATKKELGENYGMSKYAGTTEWDKQIAHLESTMIGKTIADFTGAQLDENGKSMDTDVLSGCTVHISEFVDLLNGALSTEIE